MNVKIHTRSHFVSHVLLSSPRPPSPSIFENDYSSLEWVGVLTPDALDAFLVEKLEARRALVELDLEPSGLVIKHDEEGELERVEPAMVEKVRMMRCVFARGARVGFGHKAAQ